MEAPRPIEPVAARLGPELLESAQMERPEQLAGFLSSTWYWRPWEGREAAEFVKQEFRSPAGAASILAGWHGIFPYSFESL